MYKYPLALLLIWMNVTANAQQKTDSTLTSDSGKKTPSKIIQFKKSLWYSTPLITLGIIANSNRFPIDKYSFQQTVSRQFPHVHTNIDNYLQHVPIAVVYGLDIFGAKGAHDAWNQTALLVKSEMVMNLVVQPLKKWTHVLRPNSTDAYVAFPSGHTAQAFLSAEFLRKEYGATHPWIAVGGYAAATAVGALRIIKNRHWISDVLMGAGTGILSVNLVYLTHQNKWPLWKKKIQVTPAFSGNCVGFYVTAENL